MAHKSIVDRVLILAAAICAAALVWQLTVLLTSKGRTSTGGSLMAVASGPSARADVAQPAAPTPPAIRVVYAGTEASTKTSVKASDPPVPAPEPASASTRPDPSAGVEPPASAGLSGSPDQPAPGPLALASTQPADTVPAEGDPDQTTVSTTSSSGSASRLRLATAEPPVSGDDPATSKPATNGAIDLNHASIESLNHLRGAGHIGQAIVSHRPYRSVEDLVKKRVLRRDVYEQIKQMVVTE